MRISDWSSDVCSSDLVRAIDQGSVFTLWRVLPEFLEVDFTGVTSFPIPVVVFMGRHDYTTPSEPTPAWIAQVEAQCKAGVWVQHRSEERRVGREGVSSCRSRGWPAQSKKKIKK